jgi:crotonobetainyl-CoA:carnitine CoA-transferase CaiB-like acyl-CoA transferase
VADSVRPLDGLRVLDFSHVLAGPFATRVLGDMGADVVKVSSQDRAVGANDPAHPYYLMWNRNKRALALNMKEPASRALAAQLCTKADVVVDNFSVGVLERWGIGYADTSPANPGIIYLQMSGMGDGGPWSNYVTYAPTIHALSGLTHLTGVPGREDIGIGFSYNDHQAGLHGAVAILAALESRRQTGKGQRIDVSQFEVGVNFLGPALLDLFANEKAARPCGNDLPYDAVAPHGCYPCATTSGATASNSTADERWVAIACMTDPQWQSFKRVLGQPAWADAPDYAQAQGRVAHRKDIDQHIAQWTQQLQDVEVMERCQAAGVPAGVVQNGVDLVDHDPQLAAREFIQPCNDQHPTLGQTWAERLPLYFDKTPCDEHLRVREVGEDNATVLSDWLGLSESDVAAAAAKGLLD